MSLPLRKFFEPQPDFSTLLINCDRNYRNKWVFGNSFLINFHSLDYDNHLITLYSNEGIKQTKAHDNTSTIEVKKSNDVKGSYYIIVQCLMLFGLFQLISIRVVFLNQNSFKNI